MSANLKLVAPGIPTTKGEWALWLAGIGLPVFPLHPNTKLPAITGWPEAATTDPKRINAWWKNGPERNIGIATGGQLADGHHLVIDLDKKSGKDGFATLKALCAKLDIDDGPTSALTATFRVATPSGGEHVHVSTAVPGKSVVNVPGPGIDLRGDGGFAVGPGSTINGKAYQVIDMQALAILPCPEALEAKCPAASSATTLSREERQKPVEGVDPARARDRALKYLATLQPAVENQGGDLATFKAAAQLKDMGCTEAEAFEFLVDWNERCEPPWDTEDLQAKVRHAYQYGKDKPGIGSPEAVFREFIDPDARPDTSKHPVHRLNEEFAFVLFGGSDFILWETTDENGNPRTEFLNVPTFHRKHANKLFQADNGRARPVSEWWMEWPGRREYSAVVFAPGRDLGPRFYNLWQGFAVESKRGKWKRMRDHILNVICSGDEKLFRYVLGWLARLVQHPGEVGEVALVFKGGKGVGKGVVGHALRRIFGRHGFHVANAKHLVGNFNAHLRGVAFLFADEAFFAGDRAHESALKSLITEPTLAIEAKGKDTVAGDNCLHVLMASNEDWVVPTSVDERRFAVIDVSADRQGDFAYFDALFRELYKEGGLEAMLFDLLAYPLDDFNVRQVPNTKALADQKLLGLRGPLRWLHEVLSEGGIARVGFVQQWDEGGMQMQKTSAYDDYCQRSRNRFGEHHPVPDKFFWKAIRQAMAHASGGLRDERSGTPRVRCVIFPPLGEARDAFEKHLRSPVEWDGEEGAGG
jgi:hypothetical protein